VLPWHDGFFKAGRVNDSISDSKSGSAQNQEYGTIAVFIAYGGHHNAQTVAGTLFVPAVSVGGKESGQPTKDNKKFWATPSLASELHYNTSTPLLTYSNGSILDGSTIKFRYDTKERVELRLRATGTILTLSQSPHSFIPHQLHH
jgi:hypothetical protein